jgi:protein SCO1/2
MASWFWTAPVISALMLAGCTMHASLPSYSVVPDFTLTDQTGATFSSKTLEGKVWIADFIFTNCAGPCPRMSSQLHQVEQKLGTTGFRYASFTIDPARDTPEVLAAYAKRYDAEPGIWYFLTGPSETLNSLCRTTFMLGNVDGKLEHSTRFVLIDKKSRVRGFYQTSEADALPRLEEDAQQLLKERF